MKRIFCFLLAASLFACTNDARVESANDSTATSTANNEPAVSLPYQLNRPADWEKGSDENVAIAMNALKSYETNDSTNMGQYIADSLEFYYDNGVFKGTREGFLDMIRKHRSGFRDISIKMHDYETVKSKARNEEWVSLWYTEVATDNSGKVDSFFTMDDLMIQNGKVRVIDTKSRKLPAQKK